MNETQAIRYANRKSDRPSASITDENARILTYYRARNLAQQRNFAQARREFVRFVKRPTDSQVQLGDALSRLGGCYWLLDQHRMAERTYRRALTQQEACSDKAGASWTRLRYAELQWKLADFDHAYQLVYQALHDFKVLHILGGESAAQQLLSDVLYWECRFAEAERCQLELIAALPSGDDTLMSRATALHRLAEIQRFQGKLGLSKNAYEQCRSLYEKLPPGYELGWTLCGLGDITRMQGDLIAAYGYTNRGLTIFNGLAFPVGIGWATRALGEILRHQGRYSGALELYSTALEYFCAANDTRGEASCWASIAEVDLSKGNVSAAKAMFLKAADSLQAEKSWYAYARVMRGLATAEFLASKTELAFAALASATDAFRRMGNTYQLSLSLLLDARIRLAQGDTVTAQRNLPKALTSCRAAGDLLHTQEIELLISETRGCHPD